MKNYVKPTVAKVNFDFTDRIARSICGNSADAGWHLSNHDQHQLTEKPDGSASYPDGCVLKPNGGAVVAGTFFPFR